ncbi:MAG: hypothetical protein FD168_1884 [Desulfobulbaceae bacterium]|nr:MAG: hypothetical protein FD168_1884 [Desulfobulbaceae bacterium]
MPPADIAFPTLTDLIPFSDQTILDTELSFRNAIGRYSLLDQAAASLIVDMAALSPEQLLLRTSQVSSMQQDLVIQDDQLISILMLAGPEILNADFIKAYRLILTKVIMSCDQIREQMTEIKKNAERLDNPQKS